MLLIYHKPGWAESTALDDDSPCFISTAAYGSGMAKEVKILKKFRDNVLLKNPVGIAFVKTYYKISPSAAEFIAKYENLRMLVRWGLLPMVGISWLALTIGFVPVASFIFLLIGLVVSIFVLCIRRHILQTINLCNFSFLSAKTIYNDKDTDLRSKHKLHP